MAPAQDIAWVATGSSNRTIVGRHITPIGDLNGDGCDDLCMMAQPECPAAGLECYLWFVSGRDGAFLREVFSGDIVSTFFAVGPAGDVDADSVPDYVVMIGGGGSIPEATQVRSGVDDHVIWSLPRAWEYLLGTVDLTGDGVNDLVVGEWRAQNYRGEMHAYAFGGALLYQQIGYVPNPPYPLYQIANDFAPLGDVDGDGRDDFVMGCADATGYGAGVVVSGATGAWLRAGTGGQPGQNIGYQVIACGDIDRDGYPEFACSNLGYGLPTVRVFSSRTAQLIHEFTQAAPALTFATRIAGGGVDLDGDDVPDIAASFPYFGFGATFAYSGRTGLQTLVANERPSVGFSSQVGRITTLRPPAGERMGLIVSAFPNAIPNPTVPCQPGWPPAQSGALVAYRGVPRTTVSVGAGCLGGLTSMPRVGMSSTGFSVQSSTSTYTTSGVRVHLTGAPANTLAVLLLGTSTTQFYGVPLPAALDPIGLPGCQLRTSIDLMCTAVAGTQGLQNGYCSVDLPFPVPLQGQGAWALSAQWWVLGDAVTFPGGMSEAIRWNY